MARINDYTRVHELADDDVLIVDSASDSGAGTRTITVSDLFSALNRRTDKSAFDYYYDLMGMDVDISASEGVTTITQNTDDASCVTTITKGEPTEISAVITPKEGDLKYIRTTTITSTESGSSIHQEYSSQAK